MSGYEEIKIDVTGYKRITHDELDPCGCLNLVAAVVHKAAKDWRAAMRYEARTHAQKRSALRSDCERFFESEYFHGLTGLDGKAVLEKLRREKL